MSSNLARRRSSDSVSPALQEASPTSSGGSAPRQTSIRISRQRSNGVQGSRSTASAGRSSGGSRSQRSSVRARRAPTPIVRRQRRQVASDLEDNDLSAAATEDEDLNVNGHSRRRRAAITRRGPDGQRSTVQVSTNSGDGLHWYERLLPDFFLNMTAPITGYENRLDSDVEDDEYEILERQRLKRNRRVRRRLLAVLLVATAASVFLYSRGRIFRKAGMKAAVSTMKHRIEGGLAKTIQETMGK